MWGIHLSNCVLGKLEGLYSKFGGKFCPTEKWMVAGNNLSFIYLQDKKQVNNNDLVWFAEMSKFDIYE